MAFMLILECGILGVFLASNLFLFYIFWEVMLIPAYFLIGSWGANGVSMQLLSSSSIPQSAVS